MYRFKYSPKYQQYEIHSQDSGAFRGSLLQVMKKAIDIGVIYDELRVAMQEMNKLNHNSADFGIFGKFIFTNKD